MEWIEIFVKKVSSPPQLFFRKLLYKIIYSGPLGLGIKNEAYNVLTLRCLSCVEPNTLMIMPFKPLVKLRFSFGIML